MPDAPQASLPAPAIDDYGVIGNLHTAALVSCHGAIDFLSLPRFDSPTAFARLLDPERGGTWSITVAGQADPAAPDDGDAARTLQHYLPGTAVIVTRHLHPGGVVEVTDFMPPVDDVSHCQVMRRVRALVGSTRVHVRLAPRPDYAREEAAFTADSYGAQTRYGFEHPGVRYYAYGFAGAANAAGDASSAALTASFELAEGDDDRWFALMSEACDAPDEPLSGFGESLLAYTLDYWTRWSSRLTYAGVHREMVERSAITLKLCTSAQFGSSVAAVTTSLPELVGGELNWDYRYTWIRDSAFTMYAMLRLGLSAEAKQFIDWIQARCEELDDAADLGLMYRVDGGTDLEERELPHLAGYRGSRPVRIGNGAAGQRQLDIYGELIDTVYLYDRFGHEITYAFWQNLRAIIDYVCAAWREPDHGIWEARGEKHQYTMSKVLAWVAIDRGIRIAQHRGFPAPLADWFAERDAIYEHIYTEHYDADLDSWTQRSGGDALDGSLLMMPLLRFVTTEEPKWRSTLDQIERRLVRDCLVARYLPGEAERAEREFPPALIGGEGYFTMCSMWYVEVLAKSGRVTEARKHLRTLCSHANHLGLFSEEIGADGRQIGNFPQAFTHLGFISAALQIEERLAADGEAGASGPQG